MPAVAALDALSTISSRAAAGDREAFRHFVERTNGTVFRVVMRMLGDSAEAQDVVQETYVRAWHGLSTLRDHNAALGWLCRIARNVATDGLRSRMSRPTQSMETLSVSDAALDVFTSQLPGPEHAASSKETRGFVMAAVASLPEKHRMVVLLRDVDGLTYEEIGAALDIPVGTVESRLHRARAALMELITRRMKRTGRSEP